MAFGLIAVTALLIFGVAALRMFRGQSSHVELDRSLYPVAGIDISAHNGDVDFDSVAASGIDFVYIKASEGTSFRDNRFRDNYERARKAGLAVGAYHFFRFDCDGRRQAMNFLAATAGCRLQLPPVIDVEEWGNPSEETTEIIIMRLREMSTLIEVTGPDGRRPMIYTNKNGYTRFLAGGEVSADGSIPEVWICSFSTPPNAGRPWTLWQHSHKGRVAGADGYVDMNTFNGSRDSWEAWLDSVGGGRTARDTQ